MSRYVIEKDGQAVNVILADSATIADYIAGLSGATARLLADGESVVMAAPELPLQPKKPSTKLEFLRRFTAPERIAIRASQDPLIVDFLQLLDMAQEVRTEDPDTIAGLSYLESVGLLATGRAAEILQ